MSWFAISCPSQPLLGISRNIFPFQGLFLPKQDIFSNIQLSSDISSNFQSFQKVSLYFYTFFIFIQLHHQQTLTKQQSGICCFPKSLMAAAIHSLLYFIIKINHKKQDIQDCQGLAGQGVLGVEQANNQLYSTAAMLC